MRTQRFHRGAPSVKFWFWRVTDIRGLFALTRARRNSRRAYRWRIRIIAPAVPRWSPTGVLRISFKNDSDAPDGYVHGFEVLAMCHVRHPSRGRSLLFRNSSRLFHDRYRVSSSMPRSNWRVVGVTGTHPKEYKITE